MVLDKLLFVAILFSTLLACAVGGQEDATRRRQLTELFEEQNQLENSRLAESFDVAQLLKWYEQDAQEFEIVREQEKLVSERFAATQESVGADQQFFDYKGDSSHIMRHYGNLMLNVYSASLSNSVQAMGNKMMEWATALPFGPIQNQIAKEANYLTQVQASAETEISRVRKRAKLQQRSEATSILPEDVEEKKRSFPFITPAEPACSGVGISLDKSITSNSSEATNETLSANATSCACPLDYTGSKCESSRASLCRLILKDPVPDCSQDLRSTSGAPVCLLYNRHDVVNFTYRLMCNFTDMTGFDLYNESWTFNYTIRDGFRIALSYRNKTAWRWKVFMKVFNFVYLNDMKASIFKNITKLQFLGEQDIVLTLNLSAISNRYLTGGRLYFEVGLYPLPHGTAASRDRRFVDFRDYKAPPSEDGTRSGLEQWQIIFIVCGSIITVVAAVGLGHRTYQIVKDKKEARELKLADARLREEAKKID